MPTLALFIFAFSLLLTGLTQSTENASPIPSKVPLTPDQIAVYRTFLERYDNGGRPLHLANRTEAFFYPDEAPCGKGLHIMTEDGAIGVVHRLDPSLAIPGRVALVDPDEKPVAGKANDAHKTRGEGKTSDEAVGLLTLSEIAFDKNHHFAAMAFSYWCGILCGHGGIVIFEKTGGRWKMTEKICGEWVS